MLRLIGRVVRTTTKSGTSSKTGNAYSIREARVLVLDCDIINVSLPDAHPDLREGDLLDHSVEFAGTFQGNPQFRLLEPWPGGSADGRAALHALTGTDKK